MACTVERRSGSNRPAGPDNRAMERVNIFAPTCEYDDTDPDGYRAGMDRFGPKIGATQLGGSVYELPPGQSICPYHYEYGDEEWLIVLEGRPTLRHPCGEDELERGDTVCFPEGPDGAHKVTNRTQETVRVLMLSTKARTAVAVYPDSDKVGVWGAPGQRVGLFRGATGDLDYFDGEV
jgi:uncharacterized cupin superfamily protein